MGRFTRSCFRTYFRSVNMKNAEIGIDSAHRSNRNSVASFFPVPLESSYHVVWNDGTCLICNNMDREIH